LKREQILLKLSNFSSIWTINSKSFLSDSYHSLQSFINDVGFISSKFKTSSIEPSDLPYHRSLFHFIFYYSYYPKIPFVIKTNNQILFGSFYDKNYSSVELSFPLLLNNSSLIYDLNELLSDSSFSRLLTNFDIKRVLLRDVPDESIQVLRASNKTFSFNLLSLREIFYQTYNIDKTLSKKGNKFANLRWHLNKFNKTNHHIEPVELSSAIKPVIHLIGNWKKTAIQNRGFSFINVKSDKLAARLFGNFSKDYHKEKSIYPTPNDCISRVLKVDGQIRSFNFGYPIGIFCDKKVFAHAIGITDLSIPHLAEYAQYEFWQQIRKEGYLYVNDGPSWKTSLETYKQKFRPIGKKRYYFATLSI